MKRSLLFVAWGVTRLIFLAFWSFAEPIGELMVWLRKKHLAA